MIDIFFRSAPQSEERYLRAQHTLAIWRSIPYLNVVVLQAAAGDSYYFQSESRKQAEAQAKTAIYLLADDDMEPSRILCPRCWLEQGLRIMGSYPQFGMLSALLEATNFSETPVAGGDWLAFEDAEVKEFHNVGGIRFIRRGIVTVWPEQLRRGYDEEHCHALQQHGFRVGYFKNLWALHPGYKSETWKPVTDYISPRLT